MKIFLLSRKFCLILLPLAVVMVVAISLIQLVRIANTNGCKVKSANNLKVIGLAVQTYANNHGGQYPDSFGTLLATQDLSASLFTSAGSDDVPAEGPTTQAIVNNLTSGGHLSYFYLGRGLTNLIATQNVVVAYENPAIWSGEGANVLYADGHVVFEDTDTIKRIVAKNAGGIFPVINP